MKAPGRAKLSLIIGSGLFLGVVLFFYEAFGIDQGISFSGHTLIERVFCFTLSVSATFGLNELIILPKIKLHSRLQKLLWIVWEIISAGTVTYFLFNFFWNFTESHWSAYFLLLGEFTSVMLIPFLIFFLIKAKESRTPDLMVFESSNGKDRVAIQPDKLMYIKSEDNYVSIVYEANGGERSSIIRRKLYDVEESHPNLIRTHRSYLVNPAAIHSVLQKPKNVAVFFEHGNSIPVSDTYVDQFIEKISHHSSI